jgi:hypothetical protein
LYNTAQGNALGVAGNALGGNGDQWTKPIWLCKC